MGIGSVKVTSGGGSGGFGLHLWGPGKFYSKIKAVEQYLKKSKIQIDNFFLFFKNMFFDSIEVLIDVELVKRKYFEISHRKLS